eukprot:TRINITY_DN1089_c0_g1_i6.p4 TRINITY_DN1089_c0_g1~~TRINITY_DN1089_c0_g1_i6.p4  ORF type:complete len:114 (-),score=15.09 TRINITY_DN1089_c0_g1_i6:78-419(-)
MIYHRSLTCQLGEQQLHKLNGRRKSRIPVGYFAQTSYVHVQILQSPAKNPNNAARKPHKLKRRQTDGPYQDLQKKQRQNEANPQGQQQPPRTPNHAGNPGNTVLPHALDEKKI